MIYDSSVLLLFNFEASALRFLVLECGIAIVIETHVVSFFSSRA